LVTDTFAPKPPGHWDVTEYVTEQPAVAACADNVTPRPATRTPAAMAAASRVGGCR
jgi:hypothetical protein